MSDEGLPQNEADMMQGRQNWLITKSCGIFKMLLRFDS